MANGQRDHSFGYRLETPDRTIVAGCETRPTDAVVNAWDSCDALVRQRYWGGTDAVYQVPTKFGGRVVLAHDLAIY